MCDKDCHITGTKSASKQARGSDEITSPTIKNDLADIKAAMTEMMSSFKTELLSHVNASISQVYQDFEQAADQEVQDDSVSAPEAGPLPEHSEDNLVDKIANFAKDKGSHSQTDLSENTVFKTFVEQFAPGEQTGPAIDHDLATIVNELLTEKLTKEKLEPVQDKYLKPENCENLVAPKINKPIWQQLKQETKNTDSTFQKIQQLALSSLYAVLQVCNNLSSKQNIEDSVIMLTHSIVLSLAANRELNLKRRDLLRSDLNKQYAALCNPSTPVSQYLFGDDLNKEMEDLSKASKLTKKVTPSQRMEPVRPRAIPKLSAEQSETVPEVENQVSHQCIQKSISNLIQNQATFTGGRLRKFYDVWKRLTSDQFILDVISHCHIDFETEPFANISAVRPQCHFTHTEQSIIDVEIAKLLNKEIIKPSQNESIQFISPIFTTPKKDGSHRVIFNLKSLNKSVTYYHFKMDTLETAIRLMTPCCFMTSIDLKDAYYSVPIAAEHQKYLKFLWRDQLYAFTCLPMGLTSSPRIFTKILKPVFATLRSKFGHSCLGYIDDSLNLGDTYTEAEKATLHAVELLISLGFMIHPEKSIITPTQIIEFLGFVLNSILMIVKLTDRKAEKITKLCIHFCHK
ncbi:Hypothetical predicted protein, partial [Paramuricea clavata]